MPIGWPGVDGIGIENQEEVGRLMGQNSLDLIEAWRPLLLQDGTSGSDIDMWAKEHQAAIETLTFRSYFKFYVCTGIIKP